MIVDLHKSGLSSRKNFQMPEGTSLNYKNSSTRIDQLKEKQKRCGTMQLSNQEGKEMPSVSIKLWGK